MKNKILLGILCIASLLTLTGCRKSPLSNHDFKAKVTDIDFTVEDYTNEYRNDDHIESVTVAKSNGNWQVEFFVLKDTDDALKLFTKNKENFEKSKTSNSKVSSSRGDNYATYSQAGDDEFMYICRIDNTVMLTKTEEKNKANAERFIRSLGY